MTHRVPRSHLNALFCFALMVWPVLPGRGATNVPTTVDSKFPLLTTAEQVHRLSRTEAAVGRQVRIRGVITCSLPEYKAAVVQDATGGIYFDLWEPPLGPPPPMGDMVEIEGVTDPGQFAPLIHATRLRRLGKSDLPEPVRPYWDQLINGSLDTLFVEIEGIITAVRTEGVTLLTHGGKIDALVFDTSGGTNGLSLKQYEGALVRLRGCLFASWDPATHQVKITQVRMFGPLVTVVEPASADIFALAPKHVADLLQFDPQASALRRVRVSGQIIEEREGEYFAMDGTNGFRFVPKETTDIIVGDLAEIVGFPDLMGPSPVLQEGLARKMGSAPLPQPRLLHAENLFRAENDALRVRVQAVLLNLSADQRTLELQENLQRFTAHLPHEGGSAASRQVAIRKDSGLRLGSRLELTGVYAGRGGNRTAGTEVASFDLLLNSAADIRVIVRAPFWTLQRLLVLLGALMGVLGLALIWIRLLRHEVQQRTAQLQKEVHDREKAEQQRALAQERARIARDLHDDLGGSLTEITMLATAGPGLTLSTDETFERMDTIAGKSRNLVHALDELVWAVDPERDTLASAARYLASYAEEFLSGLNVACRVQIPNSFPTQIVSGEVRHHLFLAVKEALNNVVRHGCATEVVFRVRLQEDRLCILITDNGTGFNTLGSSEGNGLLNLRERLEHLHGCCKLESSPGAGTTVCFELPLQTLSNPL